MSERIANIVLLVEDLNQELLIRRYLNRLGHDTRSMTVRRINNGQGSGEQYVREQYAAEVRELRKRRTRTRTCLIVMMDADTGSTTDRHKQLEGALEKADAERRGPGEAILHLIPRRNVETWVKCLNGAPADEVTDYRHDKSVNGETLRSAAINLFEWTRPNASVPDGCVPSLREGLPEFSRIP